MWINEAIIAADKCIKQGHIASRELRDISLNEKHYSDVVDDDGHQYIDIVMEGGGMHGIALVGYTYVLEQIGLRFRSIAGTSAGAINAMMLAAISSEDNQCKSVRLAHILGNMDFFSFVDGPQGKEGRQRNNTRKIISKLLNGKRFGLLMSPLALRQVFKNVTEKLGLNQGKVFFDWITRHLHEQECGTTQTLLQKLNEFPALKRRVRAEDLALTGNFTDISVPPDYAQIKVVAADITTETRAVFPEHGHLYWSDVSNINPAHFVRASMAVPFFFQPHIIEPIPENQTNQWNTLHNIDFTHNNQLILPKRVLFVDGGMISNFPFDLLHIPRTSGATMLPAMPTFGVKLEEDSRLQTINGLFGCVIAIVNASRHSVDNAYSARSRAEYRQLVKEIRIPKRIGWLDFNMSEADKCELFIQGARSAVEFLQHFNWESYLKLRQ